jgi:hypothetical protein
MRRSARARRSTAATVFALANPDDILGLLHSVAASRQTFRDKLNANFVSSNLQ